MSAPGRKRSLGDWLSRVAGDSTGMTDFDRKRTRERYDGSRLCPLPPMMEDSCVPGLLLQSAH
jgi:hypothetical protein